MHHANGNNQATPCKLSARYSPTSTLESFSTFAYLMCCSANESGRAANLRQRPVKVSSVQHINMYQRRNPSTDVALTRKTPASVYRRWRNTGCIHAAYSTNGMENDCLREPWVRGRKVKRGEKRGPVEQSARVYPEREESMYSEKVSARCGVGRTRCLTDDGSLQG